jgi:hypothetical protein
MTKTTTAIRQEEVAAVHDQLVVQMEKLVT